MLALLILAAASDPFAAARADIDVFCNRQSACISQQRREMGYFVNMMATFKDPGHATAQRCMKAGKKGRHVDWTVATPCMRKAVKGRAVGN